MVDSNRRKGSGETGVSPIAESIENRGVFKEERVRDDRFERSDNTSSGAKQKSGQSRLSRIALTEGLIALSVR